MGSSSAKSWQYVHDSIIATASQLRFYRRQLQNIDALALMSADVDFGMCALRHWSTIIDG
jgi:hypothetical protein